MRLMNKRCEASPFRLSCGLREIDDPTFARDIVNAVAFGASPLRILAREKIEDRRCRARTASRRLASRQSEPRGDEFVFVACRTVENTVILPVPAAIFSPALRICGPMPAVFGVTLTATSTQSALIV